MLPVATQLCPKAGAATDTNNTTMTTDATERNTHMQLMVVLPVRRAPRPSSACLRPAIEDAATTGQLFVTESLKLHGGEIFTVLFLELAEEVLAEAVVSADIEHVAEEGPRQTTSHDREECHLDRGRHVLRFDLHSRLRQDNIPDIERRVEEELVRTVVERGAGGKRIAGENGAQEQVLQRMQIQDRCRVALRDRPDRLHLLAVGVGAQTPVPRAGDFHVGFGRAVDGRKGLL